MGKRNPFRFTEIIGPRSGTSTIVRMDPAVLMWNWHLLRFAYKRKGFTPHSACCAARTTHSRLVRRPLQYHVKTMTATCRFRSRSRRRWRSRRVGSPSARGYSWGGPRWSVRVPRYAYTDLTPASLPSGIRRYGRIDSIPLLDLYRFFISKENDSEIAARNASGKFDTSKICRNNRIANAPEHGELAILFI